MKIQEDKIKNLSITYVEAFKTLFSRMADIQRGALDEDGMNLNQVERALKRIDVALRDSDDSFRDFEDVLGDIASKWDQLDEVTQADI